MNIALKLYLKKIGFGRYFQGSKNDFGSKFGA